LTAQELFRNLLKERVSPFLRQHGFKGSAGKYLIRREDNWGMIHLRGTRHSTARVVQFFITIGYRNTARDRLVGHSFPTRAKFPGNEWVDHDIDSPRIRALPPVDRHTWHPAISLDRPFEPVLDAVLQALEEEALPWLADRLDDAGLAAIHLQELERSVDIRALAEALACFALLGDRAGAHRCMKFLYEFLDRDIDAQTVRGLFRAFAPVLREYGSPLPPGSLGVPVLLHLKLRPGRDREEGGLPGELLLGGTLEGQGVSARDSGITVLELEIVEVVGASGSRPRAQGRHKPGCPHMALPPVPSIADIGGPLLRAEVDPARQSRFRLDPVHPPCWGKVTMIRRVDGARPLDITEAWVAPLPARWFSFDGARRPEDPLVHTLLG
jgi:hypothetical protein